MTLVGLNSGLTIANETAITKEGSRRLRSDSESHTTSLLNNRERNYRQSSVIVCSLLIGLNHSRVGAYVIEETRRHALQRTVGSVEARCSEPQHETHIHKRSAALSSLPNLVATIRLP